MVKLTEVEDEHFSEKPSTTKGDVLLASDDDDDYTDTGVISLSPACLGVATTTANRAKNCPNLSEPASIHPIFCG